MTEPEFEHVRLERFDDGVARLTIDRPERMNAITAQSFAELGEAARLLRRERARALVLTGAGDRAFCAGYDLADVPALRAASVTAFLDIEDTASGAVHALAALPFPVVAAIGGAASGGGLSLALAADIRIAAPHAVLNAAFVRVGFSIGELGTSWMLSRLVGPGMAAELSFTGRVVGAEEALAIGLIERIVPAASLQDEALALARAIGGSAGNDGPAADGPAAGSAEPRLTKRELRRASETASYAAWVDAASDDRPTLGGSR